MPALSVSEVSKASSLLDKICGGEMLRDADMGLLLRLYARPGNAVEDDRLDLKVAFEDDKTGWGNLCRQAVALHNSGGGILIFGVANDGARLGLPGSLTRLLDPAKVNDQLLSRRVPLVLKTTYSELKRYNKLFGFLTVRAGQQIVVFDQDVQGRDGRTIAQAGCVYVRRNGQSAPAHYSELQALIERNITRGVQGFLARIDRVASLPPSANLIAANPGSSEGFILTARGEGVPVQIIGPEEGAPTVTLSEEVLPDTPLSAPSLEVAGQVRQWRTDSNHRVPAALVRRWYLERSSIDWDAISGSAEFLLVSALRDNAFPIQYWASLMDRDRLREVLQQLILADPYPERLNVPYVVGAFFWSQRQALLGQHSNTHAGFGRVLRANDREGYVLNGRTPPPNLTMPNGQSTRMDDVLADRPVARVVFDACLRAGEDYIRDHRQQLHQLDLFLHAAEDDGPV